MRRRVPLTPAMRHHLDSEMAQALALSREIAQPSKHYPDCIWQAVRVAFAIHYRTLLEFFYNGRVGLLNRGKAPSERDIIISDLLPPHLHILFKPTAGDKRRFRATDRLAAHLSRDRTRYHASKQEWGCARDRRAIRRHIRALFRIVRSAEAWFPETAAELALA